MVAAHRQEAQLAVSVARLYYFQAMTTAAIAEEMGTSRATVSRLLSHAMENGLVEIRIHDPIEPSRSLEQQIKQRYQLRSIQVVPVTESAGEKESLRRVAAHAAVYVSTLMAPSTVLGLAWGTTVAEIADHWSEACSRRRRRAAQRLRHRAGHRQFLRRVAGVALRAELRRTRAQLSDPGVL